MTIIELLLIAVGLSMDAFAVSICKGLSAGKPKASNYFTVAVWFGGFQALMPFIGYLLGSTFERYITAVDHWVAFILLVLIGGNMIREALAGDSCDTHANGSFAPRAMLLLAVATSIDSLAVGITLALLPGVNIAAAVLLIGCITAVISAAGLKVGSAFGARYKNKAELAGGLILVLIGCKILLEHLGVINF